MNPTIESTGDNIVPHEFTKLREGARPAILFCGSGLSWDLVPRPDKLLQEYKSKAEEELGCIPVPPEGLNLYIWAENIIAQLEAFGNPEPSKLRLARSLGITSNREWVAGVAFEYASHRHRVIARLSRDELWPNVWTLNWDCLLESALESVGFEYDGSPRKQPWKTVYSTIVTGKDFKKVANTKIFCVLKPHGCASRLIEAERAIELKDFDLATELSERFIITKTELENGKNDNVDKQFMVNLTASLHGAPLIILGWSVSEPYLNKIIEGGLKVVVEKSTEEEFSIIDTIFNDAGHKKLSDYYELEEKQVHFCVDKDVSSYDTDDLFLWIQAKYCLEQIKKRICEHENIKRSIMEKSDLLKYPDQNSFLLDWADEFIPAWTRLCWRAGIIECEGFRPDELPLNKTHEHIPFSTGGVFRNDLRAAAILLDKTPQEGGGLNVRKFPGAYYKSSGKQLIVPLPAWGNMKSLKALKPLYNVLKRDIGFVKETKIFPLHYDPNHEIQSDVSDRLQEMWVNEMSVPGFASLTNVEVISNLDF